MLYPALLLFFFFNHPATTEIYTLSLHDALPISATTSLPNARRGSISTSRGSPGSRERSEEHASELQSRFDLVCRLLLEKKKKTTQIRSTTKTRYLTTSNSHSTLHT